MSEISTKISSEQKDKEAGSVPDIFPAYLSSIGKIKRLSDEETRGMFLRISDMEKNLLLDLCQIKNFVSFLHHLLKKMMQKEVGLPEISSN